MTTARDLERFASYGLEGCDILLAVIEAYPVRRAGVVIAPSPTAPQLSAVAPRPSEVQVGPDGRIAGIDGMLDQVTGSATRAVRNELWPTIAESGVAERMAAAHGAALGCELRPWVAVGSVGLAAGGAALLYRAVRR
jgi:hypothetical protein